MPGNLSPAAPVSSSAVLPQSLSTSFVAVNAFPMLSTGYHDGTLERSLITDTVNAPRTMRTWKLAKRLNVTNLNTLLSFWETVTFGGFNAFYFYDPYEPASGQKVGSNYDPTGVSTQGRALVFFRGSNWSHALRVGRSEVPNLELVEVA